MRASTTRRAGLPRSPGSPAVSGTGPAGSRTQHVVPAPARSSGPNDPMLLTLRDELRSGAWPPDLLLTRGSLQKRFGTTSTLTSAVVRVLRDEGLLKFDGSLGVRAIGPRTRGPGVTGTVTDRIVETVRERLASKVYPPGQRLPVPRQFAEEFNTVAPTVRLALLQLTLEGLLRPAHSHEAAGTYAVDPSREAREAHLVADLQTALNRGGWERAEYPDVVARALHVLMGSAGEPGSTP